MVGAVVDDRRGSATQNVDDPLLRAAVLDLFQANRAFTEAYRDYASTHADRQLRAIAEAERRIDAARERVTTFQSLHAPRDDE